MKTYHLATLIVKRQLARLYLKPFPHDHLPSVGVGEELSVRVEGGRVLHDDLLAFNRRTGFNAIKLTCLSKSRFELSFCELDTEILKQ
jgi:hypothetical protein